MPTTPAPAPKTPLDRRAFLQVGVAGIATLACPAIRAAESPDDPYRGLKVGMHTYTLRKFSFADAVRITQEMGVRYIGFNPVHVPLDSPPEKLAEARAHAQEAGLTILACGVISFGADAAKARQAFEFAKAMGMPTIAANPTPDSFDILDGLVEEFGIRIAIHNHGPDSRFSTPADLLEAIEGHHEGIGACVDIGHYERSNVRALDALRALRGRVYDMHLKDVDRPIKAGKSVPLGTGIIDLEAVFRELLETRCQAHIALEYEGKPNDPIADIRQSYEHAREILKRLA